MKTCVPHLSAHRHGSGREILHLLQVEVQLLGDGSQFGHVGCRAARVRTDEIGDELLMEPLLGVDAVKDAFELVELLEGRLAHEHEHLVGGVLGSHFETPADMTADEFAGVLGGGLVAMLVGASVQEQVVAHATADETLLDLRQGINGLIHLEQGRVVGM